MALSFTRHRASGKSDLLIVYLSCPPQTFGRSRAVRGGRTVARPGCVGVRCQPALQEGERIVAPRFDENDRSAVSKDPGDFAQRAGKLEIMQNGDPEHHVIAVGRIRGRARLRCGNRK